MSYTRWNTYSSYLKSRYGHPVYRIGVDGGFSCPNRNADKSGGCAFCDGTGSVAVYQRQSESGFFHDSDFESEVSSRIIARYASIENQIRKGQAFVKARYKTEDVSLYFQSWTNTYDSVDNLKRIYDRALSLGRFRELIISTRPDCIDEEKARLLSSYITADRDVWVELGLQSANDNTLSYINRGHSAASYMEASELLHSFGLKVSTHIIIGLPYETRADYDRTLRFVNDAGSEAVKIHNLHVAGGTRLEDEYREGLFTASSTLRHLENAERALRLLKKDIIVQRLVCETPMHRLAAPRHFYDKSRFLTALESRMNEHDTRQGDLYGT